MFTSPEEVLQFIQEEGVQFVDVRFTDLPGSQHHFNVPATSVDLDFFAEGQLFDGSSIRGFQGIAESDMQLIPDVATAFIDQFRSAKTLAMSFSITNPRTGEPYGRDPRWRGAEGGGTPGPPPALLDTAIFAPEAQFFLFERSPLPVLTWSPSTTRSALRRLTGPRVRTMRPGTWATSWPPRAAISRSPRRTRPQRSAMPSVWPWRRPAWRSNAPTTKLPAPASRRSTTGSTR